MLTKTRFPLIFAILLMPWHSSQALNAVGERVLAALQQSNLSPLQKAQHMMNRLGYGTNVETMKSVWLIGNEGEAAANLRIAGKVQTMLGRRNKSTPAIQNKVFELYPTANRSDLQIFRVNRNKYEAFRSYRDALEKIVAEGGTPTAAQMGHLEVLRKDFHAFVNEIRLAEQAEQLAYAVADDDPFFWVLLDFWFNHFNVSAEKVGIDISWYRDVIGSKMFGKFSELLLATARHPAMNVYLDNYLNHVEKFQSGAVEEFLNENYGREIMELHSLARGSSNASDYWHYNQNDVVQAARIFTGWGVEVTYEAGRSFKFSSSAHAPGTKKVMGQTFPEGEAGGKEFIKFLAGHPLTIENIARKLTLAFVSEDLSDPSAAAVQAKIKTALAKPDAQLQDAYVEIFASPQFWSKKNYRTKVKHPLRYVASCMRATGYTTATITRRALALGLGTLTEMGQNLLWYSFPTGFPMRSNFWGGSSAAIAGVRFGFEIAGLYGPPGSSVITNYLQAENAARAYWYSPIDMAVSARIGFKSVMDFAPYNERYGFTASIVGNDYEGAFNVAGREPDHVNGAQFYEAHKFFPIRTLMGIALGSADFMKH